MTSITATCTTRDAIIREVIVHRGEDPACPGEATTVLTVTPVSIGSLISLERLQINTVGYCWTSRQGEPRPRTLMRPSKLVSIVRTYRTWTIITSFQLISYDSKIMKKPRKRKQMNSKISHPGCLNGVDDKPNQASKLIQVTMIQLVGEEPVVW